MLVHAVSVLLHCTYAEFSKLMQSNPDALLSFQIFFMSFSTHVFRVLHGHEDILCPLLNCRKLGVGEVGYVCVDVRQCMVYITSINFYPMGLCR